MRLPANKAKLNKAKLHTDTHMHTYTDTDSALITSESTEAENCKRGLKPPLPHLSSFPVSSRPKGESIRPYMTIDLERSICGGQFQLSGERLALYFN